MERLSWPRFLVLLGILSLPSGAQEALESPRIDGPSDTGKVAFLEHSPSGEPPSSRKPFFYVYSDQWPALNHFMPTGWMGDWGDLRLENHYKDPTDENRHCLRITYSGAGAQRSGWAGIYWQTPANNWGGLPGGYDLRGMKHVTFWARGETEPLLVQAFKIGGIGGEFPDSDTAQIGPVTLTKAWRQYTIDTRDLELGKISGGFAVLLGQHDNNGPVTFYLDDIRYELE